MSRRGPRLAGDEFGALRLPSLGHLYGDQGRAAEEIIREVHAIAVAAFSDRTRYTEGSTHLDAPIGLGRHDFDRPHHAYVIDGRRGSGKTSVLLTLYPYLRALRLGGGDDRGDEVTSAAVMRDVRSLGLPVPEGAHGESVALVLPIVFTEDMELQETTMEAVFALMEHELEDRVRRAAHDPARKHRLSELREDLRSKVGLAWTYSRKIGAETLPSDALDYDDFVGKRADLSRSAYTKATTWRRFVDRYLDALGHQVLVLLFDDSDLNPAIAEDMVRAVRMYLSHPRVVSIVAVDLETLRQTLVWRSVADHRIVHMPSTFVEDSFLDSLKEDAAFRENSNADHLLGKVLPRPNRYRLALEDLRHLDRFFGDEEQEGSASPTVDRFGEFCRAAYARATDGVERFTWWFLHGPYRRVVSGDLRGVVSFRRQVQGGQAPLLAILDRHELSDLFERADGSLDILGPMVEGNEFDTAPEPGLGEEEIRFIDLWLDARMASAGLEAGPMGIVASWLPVSDLAGEAHELSDEGRVFGVSALLRGNLAPRNCLYLHQFRHIEKILEELLPEPSPFVQRCSVPACGVTDRA